MTASARSYDFFHAPLRCLLLLLPLVLSVPHFLSQRCRFTLLKAMAFTLLEASGSIVLLSTRSVSGCTQSNSPSPNAASRSTVADNGSISAPSRGRAWLGLPRYTASTFGVLGSIVTIQELVWAISFKEEIAVAPVSASRVLALEMSALPGADGTPHVRRGAGLSLSAIAVSQH